MAKVLDAAYDDQAVSRYLSNLVDEYAEDDDQMLELMEDQFGYSMINPEEEEE